MIQIFINDGELVYDSRLPDYALIGLKVEQGLNKGGVAYIEMPPGHPAYDAFKHFKTEVNIYRDGMLLFRGRALYPTDNFRKQRTITCEGERCFFRDSYLAPYAYQDEPAALFREAIEAHNSLVEAFKQFAIGTVDVTVANGAITLENEKAEPVSDFLDKLVEACGGYIIFTTNQEGERTVNWLQDVAYSNGQVIEFGANLLDYTRTDENMDPVSIIVPYGAKKDSGGYTSISEASGGPAAGYYVDNAALQRLGAIFKVVYWDDVTDPNELLQKAQSYVAEHGRIISSLELTAVDLSALDKSIDSFRVGDMIRVRSKPHGIDEEFQLTECALDLLHPEANRIVLGKNVTSLTGSTAAGNRQNAQAIQKVERTVSADYSLNQAAIIEETKATLTSLIQQTSEELRLEVAEQYTTNEDLESAISTSMTQLADSFNFLFTELQTVVDANDAEARAQLSTIEKYIRFEDGNIILGESGNELTLRIENDRISFLDNGAEVAYLSNKRLVVLDGHFLHSLQIGNFAFLPRENGNLSLTKVG